MPRKYHKQLKRDYLLVGLCNCVGARSYSCFINVKTDRKHMYCEACCKEIVQKECEVYTLMSNRPRAKWGYVSVRIHD